MATFTLRSTIDNINYVHVSFILILDLSVESMSL